MKSVLKGLILSIIILLVSGCTASYNIDIKKDLRVEENITFMEKNDTILTYARSIDNYINYTVNNMRSNKQYNANNYYTEKVTEGKYTGVRATYVYSEFSSFKQNSILMKNFFSDMAMNTNGDVVNIKFTSVTGQYAPMSSDGLDGAVIDKLILTIKVPYKVSSNNADKFDKLNNVYTWKYNKDTAYKDIELTFNKNELFKVNLIDRLVDIFNHNIGIFLIGLLVVIGIIVIVYITKINLRTNEI